jgi:hypothetical protein
VSLPEGTTGGKRGKENAGKKNIEITHLYMNII